MFSNLPTEWSRKIVKFSEQKMRFIFNFRVTYFSDDQLTIRVNLIRWTMTHRLAEYSEMLFLLANDVIGFLFL